MVPLLTISPILQCVILCKEIHSSSFPVGNYGNITLALGVTKIQSLSPFFPQLNCMAFISKMFHKSACSQFWPILSKMSINLCLTVDKLLQAKLLPTLVYNLAHEQCLPPMQGRCFWFSRVPKSQRHPQGRGLLLRSRATYQEPVLCTDFSKQLRVTRNTVARQALSVRWEWCETRAELGDKNLRSLRAEVHSNFVIWFKEITLQ